MSDYEEYEAAIQAQIIQIAQKLREEREKARISQMDLSFLAGLSQNHVYCIESGKRTPNLYTILRICKALRINPAILFESRDEDRLRDRETIMRLVSKYI